jgi:hypothetical protein
VDDGLAFYVACRNETWQRPLHSSHYLPRRNLRIEFDGASLTEPTEYLLIDSLLPETAPRLDYATFIARVFLKETTGLLSPFNVPIGAGFNVKSLLSVVSGPVGCLTTACKLDPVEGEVYGLAQALLLHPTAEIEFEELSR